MFKQGDKVICIDECESLDIFLNKEYTVEYYSEKDKCITLIETQFVYDVDENINFMTIKEYRKEKIKKINKLCSILETK